MFNIIESAIITIIISFISGLLLEYYKNLAPRIICNVGKGIAIEKNNKNIYAYILTIRNTSNKIIHDITINVQSTQNNLEIEHAKITSGLKFDSSIKDNILEVDIPFLSKDDEFSVTLYIENEYGVNRKPVVIMRSPEKFREVHSLEQKKMLSSLLPKLKNNKAASKKMNENKIRTFSENDDFTIVMDKVSDTGKTKNKRNKERVHENKKAVIQKKAMTAAIVMILFICVLGIKELYSYKAATNAQTPNLEANDNEKSNSATESKDATTKNTSSNSSTSGTAKNSGTKSSSGGTTKNSGSNPSTDQTNRDPNTKASNSGSDKNAETKKALDALNDNTDAKAAANSTSGNNDAKPATDGAAKNPTAKPSTSDKTQNTETKAPSNTANGNTGN